MPSQVYAHKRYVKICISFVLNLQFYTQIYPKISKCFLLFYHILRGALSTHSKWDLLYQPTKSETNIILHYQNFVSYLRWKTKWKSKINTDNHVRWVMSRIRRLDRVRTGQGLTLLLPVVWIEAALFPSLHYSQLCWGIVR